MPTSTPERVNELLASGSSGASLISGFYETGAAKTARSPAVTSQSRDATPYLGEDPPRHLGGYGEDARVVLEVLFAAYESARKGAKVMMPFKTKAAKPIDLWQKPASGSKRGGKR